MQTHAFDESVSAFGKVKRDGVRNGMEYGTYKYTCMVLDTIQSARLVAWSVH